MRKTFLIILVAFIELSIMTEPAWGNDWNYWSSYTVGASITDKLNWTFYPEFRFKDDMSHHFYSHYDFGLGYHWKSWIDLGLNYRYVDAQSSAGWRDEHRPHANLTLKWQWDNFKLSNRCRLEYRVREAAADSWRYRNLFTLKLPLAFTKFKISPYIADEFFVDFDIGELNENRIYIGTSAKFSEHINGSLYYVLQSKKSGGDWIDINVLGTKLGIKF